MTAHPPHSLVRPVPTPAQGDDGLKAEVERLTAENDYLRMALKSDTPTTFRAALATYQTPAAVELVEACRAWVKADAEWDAAITVWEAAGRPVDPDPTGRLTKLKPLVMADDAIDAAVRAFAREHIGSEGGGE